MRVYILNSKIKKRNCDGIVLDENDFHPCHPFFVNHPAIIPESVDFIYVKGIFEQHPYIRAVLRYCDYMLAPHGKLHIEFYNKYFDSMGYAIRPRNHWQYELSLVFQDRILLKEQNSKNINSYFQYEKVTPFLPKGDTIERWTFGIVSDGRKNERILALIKRIYSFKIKEFEILICGPSPSPSLPDKVRVLSDKDLYLDLRVPISKKKNLIIKEARYNNLIVMHDRIFFPDDWYEKMKKYGNYFDLLCCPILNEEDHMSRMNDWGTSENYPDTLNMWEKIFARKKKITYEEWQPNINVNGGFFQIKKHLGMYLNPNLNWGEREDVNMSVRAYNKGVLISFNPNNIILSQGVRFKGAAAKKMSVVKYLFSIYYRYRNLIKERKEFLNYLNQ